MQYIFETKYKMGQQVYVLVQIKKNNKIFDYIVKEGIIDFINCELYLNEKEETVMVVNYEAKVEGYSEKYNNRRIFETFELAEQARKNFQQDLEDIRNFKL